MAACCAAAITLIVDGDGIDPKAKSTLSMVSSVDGIANL